MADFLQNWGAGIGFSVGLLPQLLRNLFGSSNNDFGGGSGDGGTSQANPNLPQSFIAPPNTTGYAGGGPDGIYSATMSNFTPNAGGSTNMVQSGQNQMGGLQGLMNALNPQKTAAPQGGTVIGIPVQPPNYGNSVSNLAALLPALNTGLAQTGPGGLPLGTAAANPLLQFFKSRFAGGV